MDKKEINSPKLTANFLFWVAGVGGVTLGTLCLENLLRLAAGRLVVHYGIQDQAISLVDAALTM
jgi:hypothetical protein